jgi:hypothetical protein
MRIFSTAVVLGLLAAFPGQQATAQWGAFKGQIVFEGDKIPPPEKIEVTKDKEHCLAKGDLPKEAWVVNPKNKGVRWAMVWLAPEQPGDELPVHPALKNLKKKEVEMDQPCCRFIPHCLIMREGQVLRVKNSAPISHSVMWAGNGKVTSGGNVTVPPSGSHRIKGLKCFKKFPIVNIACYIHPWMSAKVVVLDHPYFAVTDKDGKFEIKNAPAGNYRLIVWHEEIGWRGGFAGRNGQKITIKAGGVTDLGKLGLKP